MKAKKKKKWHSDGEKHFHFFEKNGEKYEEEKIILTMIYVPKIA